MRDSIALALFSGVCFILSLFMLAADMPRGSQIFAHGIIISLVGAFICSAVEKQTKAIIALKVKEDSNARP